MVLGALGEFEALSDITTWEYASLSWQMTGIPSPSSALIHLRKGLFFLKVQHSPSWWAFSHVAQNTGFSSFWETPTIAVCSAHLALNKYFVLIFL